MIQPTRTNLLHLKERVRSVDNSVQILKTKRRALVQEFLNTTMPFLRTRQEIKSSYGRALRELALSVGIEGKEFMEALSARAAKEPTVKITDRSLWGIKYRDVEVYETAEKTPMERDYDFASTTRHLEEGIHLFERLVDSIVQVAAFESKMKRLAEEIRKTNRRTRVLEERVLPRLKSSIKAIEQYIDERDRESYCRLKRVKGKLNGRKRE